jgi:hypothetical protein
VEAICTCKQINHPASEIDIHTHIDQNSICSDEEELACSGSLCIFTAFKLHKLATGSPSVVIYDLNFFGVFLSRTFHRELHRN